ncbi:MAG TPA: excinuclease ABC subunit UvrB [bacterium]|nr:excinuclease ABC subunit UvrB [bacterium]
MFKLSSPYKISRDQEKSVSQIIYGFDNEKKRKQVLLGVTGSGKTYVMANIIEKRNRPTLILSHNKTLAAQLYEEFKEFFPNNAVKYFVSYYDYYQPEAYIPARDVYIEKESDVNKEIEKLRMSAMNAVLTRKDVVVIASVSAIYNIGNPNNYKNHSLILNVKDELDLSTLSRKLVFMQYHRNDTSFEGGTFRIKGDIFDIYTPYYDFPIRIEFLGKEIDRIYYIDPITAQKIAELDSIEIFPTKTFIFENDIIKNATENIKIDLDERVKFLKNIGKNLEAERLKQRTLYDIEMLYEVGYCKGMENYSIYFEDRKSGQPPWTLLDYFPEDYMLFIDESHITLPQVRGMYNGDRSRKETLIEYGFRLPSATDNRPLNFNEFLRKQGGDIEAAEGATLYISATPNQWEINESRKSVVELLTRPTGLLDPEIHIRPTENQIDDVINEVQKVIKKKQRVLITTLTKRMAEDLSSYLTDNGISAYYLHSDIDTVERVEILRDLRMGKHDVLVGINLLREGIDLPEVSLVIILDADKEGFLRSKTSLVQIIGRAARHVEGRVILYADKRTENIQYAVSETERRRKYQLDYNKKHNITPRSIKKDIRDSLVTKTDDSSSEISYQEWIKSSKPPKQEIKRVIDSLNEKMLFHAANLEFEKAAKLRDEIEILKEDL